MGVATHHESTLSYAAALALTSWLALNLALSLFMFARMRYRLGLWLAQLAPLAIAADPWISDAHYQLSLAVLVFCLCVSGRRGGARPALSLRWGLFGASIPVLVIGLIAASRGGYLTLLAVTYGTWGAWWCVPISALVTMTLRSQLPRSFATAGGQNESEPQAEPPS